MPRLSEIDRSRVIAPIMQGHSQRHVVLPFDVHETAILRLPGRLRAKGRLKATVPGVDARMLCRDVKIEACVSRTSVTDRDGDDMPSCRHS